jgi:hypothetical protein
VKYRSHGPRGHLNEHASNGHESRSDFGILELEMVFRLSRRDLHFEMLCTLNS